MDTSLIFPLNNANIRTVVKGDETYFCVKDVCQAMCIKNPRDKNRLLSGDEKVVASIDTPGGRQNTGFCTESGLYHIIFSTRKNPSTEPFKRWVTHEVLPEIRKTGQYKLKAQYKLQLEDLTRKMNEAKIRADGFSVDQIINSDAAIKSVFSSPDENGVYRSTHIGRSVIRSFFTQKYKHTCPDILSKSEKKEVVNYVRTKLVYHEGKIYYKS